MVAVWTDSVQVAGASYLSLQPVERPPERTMQCGGKGDWLEMWQMLSRADL
jgi:hypothetical protein